jgi:hypothetical protein
VPFHVEISSPLDRARVLDVDEAELRTEILEPWVAGLPFKFGGRDWEPRESRLTLLEGPALGANSGGEDGWENVLRAAEDVTRRMLEAAEASAPAQIAVVVEADSVEAALKNLQSGKPPRQIPWAAAFERIGSRDPDVTAVIIVVKQPKIDWPEFWRRG